jgi:hypothetical protein
LRIVQVRVTNTVHLESLLADFDSCMLSDLSINYNANVILLSKVKAWCDVFARDASIVAPLSPYASIRLQLRVLAAMCPSSLRCWCTLSPLSCGCPSSAA